MGEILSGGVCWQGGDERNIELDVARFELDGREVARRRKGRAQRKRADASIRSGTMDKELTQAVLEVWRCGFDGSAIAFGPRSPWETAREGELHEGEGGWCFGCASDAAGHCLLRAKAFFLSEKK